MPSSQLLKEMKELELCNNLAVWTQEYISLKTGSFSFDGHEYLREIYEQNHPYIILEKASQMGASVYALSRSIWACETRGMKVIYFFPTDGDVIDFSQDRFSEIEDNSPHVAELLTPVDSRKPIDKVKLKQIGKGSLYFRGLFHSRRSRDGQSGAKTKSVDADFLVFDELDEAQPRQKEAAKHRIDHSCWKWILELSTPTIPDYGIDIEFQKSDQRYWMLKCPHCGEWNCLEAEFPRCLKRTSQETVILACKKCRKQLDPAKGRWVAKYPGVKKRRGYHICQLYSTFIDLNDVLNDYEDSNVDLQLFHNHRLGKPYIEAENRLQKEEIYACCRSDLTFPGKANRGSMGVDVGKREMHVYITAPHESGKRRTVFIGTVQVSLNPKEEDFANLVPLMNRFDVHTCVIDAQPETHAARKFARRFKRRVYLCYYSDSQKDDLTWTDSDVDGVGRVTANRTESLDATFRQLRRQELLLPRRDGMIEEFALHCYNLVRVKELHPTSGEIKYRYKAVGDDHKAHARNYCRMAEIKGAGKRSRIFVFGKRTF